MDDKLSRLASMVFRIKNCTEEGFDDIAKFNAPSECNAMVRKAHCKVMTRLFDASDLTPGEYNDLLDERLGKKTAYFSGLQVEPEDFPSGYYPYPE